MKIIFLDIDGVLQSGQDRAKHGNAYLCPDKIALLNDAIDRTDAEVVVCSSWRSNDNCVNELNKAGVTALHEDWRTPLEEIHSSGLILGAVRGDQIDQWLREHPQVKKYAIIDDEWSALPHQADHVVQPEFVTGLNSDHVEKVVDILS